MWPNLIWSDLLNQNLCQPLIDLFEGHWEYGKHAIMLGCLCKAPLREEGPTHLQNGET